MIAALYQITGLFDKMQGSVTEYRAICVIEGFFDTTHTTDCLGPAARKFRKLLLDLLR